MQASPHLPKSCEIEPSGSKEFIATNEIDDVPG